MWVLWAMTPVNTMHIAHTGARCAFENAFSGIVSLGEWKCIARRIDRSETLTQMLWCKWSSTLQYSLYRDIRFFIGKNDLLSLFADRTSIQRAPEECLFLVLEASAFIIVQLTIFGFSSSSSVWIASKLHQTSMKFNIFAYRPFC